MAEGDNHDDGQKTEQPTGKKLSEAREQGQVVISREINHLLMLGAFVVVLVLLLPMLIHAMRAQLTALIERPDQIVINGHGLQRVVANILYGIGLPLFLIAFVCIGASIFSHGMQTGFNITPSRLIPDLARLSPGKGFARIFSWNSLFDFLRNVVKFLIIGSICASVFWPEVRRLETFTGLDPAAQVYLMYRLTLRMLITIMMIMTVIGIVDYAYQYLRFIRQMRMTREEVKDEHKQSEGDPIIKGRLRRMRLERTRRRMMANVPEADVVITNPTHFAVALKYDSNKMTAPVVIAKGQDFIALKIRELAAEHKIVIVENPPLARTLYASVEVDEEIPTEHYRAVAEVISYVYKLRNKTKPRPAQAPVKKPSTRGATPPRPAAP